MIKRIFIGIMLFSILIMPAFAYRYTVPRVAGTTGTINYTQGRNENIKVVCEAGDVGKLVVVGQNTTGGATYELVSYTDVVVSSYHKFGNIKSIVLTTTSTTAVTVYTTNEGIVCTLEAGSKGRWSAFLLDGSTYNLPINNTVSTDAIDTERDIDTASKIIDLKCSDIDLQIPVKYQISDDNINWINGSATFSNADNNTTRTLITDKSAKYIKLVFTSAVITSETPATVKGFVIH